VRFAGDFYPLVFQLARLSASIIEQILSLSIAFTGEIMEGSLQYNPSQGHAPYYASLFTTASSDGKIAGNVRAQLKISRTS
jgi:hypothetical protein